MSNPCFSKDKVLDKGYYLVVAAYSSSAEDFAIRYVKDLNKNGSNASYGLDEKRKLFYVYLEAYSSFEKSIDEMLKVRSEGKFDKAWVRVIKETPISSSPASEPSPEKTEQKEPTKTTDYKQEPNTTSVPTTIATEPVIKQTENPEEQKPVVKAIANEPAKPLPKPQTPRNTNVLFRLYNATNNELLEGEVEVVDAVTSKLITKAKGNEYIALPKPGNNTGELLLVSNVFGFRKEELQLNYKNTEADTLKPYVSLVDNHYIISFELTKIHKGDISTLYNVYFFNDAAIMLPTSLYQLNSLLDLLTENPTYKITLHGHTNGTGRGKITYMGPDKNFFAITKDVVQGSGSAKELSEARAQVIKEWLVSQNIAENRISVKGWGGSRMIHDKNSVHARKNIRVDVEIVDE